MHLHLHLHVRMCAGFFFCFYIFCLRQHQHLSQHYPAHTSLIAFNGTCVVHQHYVYTCLSPIHMQMTFTYIYIYIWVCMDVCMNVVKFLHLKICIIIVLWLQTFIHNIYVHTVH